MPLYQAIVQAIVQGITEFLPVSSTAHLVLVPWFLGWQDRGLTFDIAVHAGTLVAVLAYFRATGWTVQSGARLGRPFKWRRFAGTAVCFSTLPSPRCRVGWPGFFLKSSAENDFRHPS